MAIIAILRAVGNGPCLTTGWDASERDARAMVDQTGASWNQAASTGPSARLDSDWTGRDADPDGVS